RDPHRGGLARSVGADEPEQLAGGDVEGQVVERDDVAEALGEPVELEAAPGARQSRPPPKSWRKNRNTLTTSRKIDAAIRGAISMPARRRRLKSKIVRNANTTRPRTA